MWKGWMLFCTTELQINVRGRDQSFDRFDEARQFLPERELHVEPVPAKGGGGKVKDRVGGPFPKGRNPGRLRGLVQREDGDEMGSGGVESRTAQADRHRRIEATRDRRAAVHLPALTV